MAEGWSGNDSWSSQESLQSGVVGATTEDSTTMNLAVVSKTIPCRFYIQGKCIYGDSCRYLHESECSTTVPVKPNPPILSDWINAPEFVPSWSLPVSLSDETDFPPIGATEGSQEPDEKVEHGENAVEVPEAGAAAPVMSYARAVDPNAGLESAQVALSSSELCPYFLMGLCRYGEECAYIHGEVCDLCSQPCLHPLDQIQRFKHREDCMRQHQVDMEKSFAVARSRDKACGICMETIWEKLPSTKQRFGLLPNCSHCFCLDCIRKWRQEKQFENKIIRSCPECRVQSDFVCPSRYWCETKEEKEKLITDYKQALSNKACKYFNQGRGECPFGNRCFYQHALADGTKADVGPPSGKFRRRRIGPDEEEAEFFRVLLWDFLEERESRYVVQLGLDLDDLDLFTSDSDDYDLDDDGSDLFLLH